MKYLRIGMAIVGGVSLFLGVLLLFGVIFNFDPTGGIGMNLFATVIFVLAFCGLGGGLLYGAYRLGR